MVSSRAKSLFAAYCILFLDNFAFAIIFPILPVLFLNPSFGIFASDLSEVARHLYLGIILVAFPFAQFFGAPFFGALSDRLGRKKALYLTLTGTLLGSFLTGIGIVTKLYTIIFLSRLLTGFCAGNLTIVLAIIADMHFSQRKRARSFSYATACLGVSWIIALLVGWLFTEPSRLELLGPSFLFWMTGVITAISLCVIWKLYRETVRQNPNGRLQLFKGLHQIVHVLEHQQLRVLYLVLFFWFFGFFITLHWAVPIATEKFQASTLNLFWMLISLGILWSLSTAFLNPWLIRRHGSLWQSLLWSLFVVSLFYFFGAVADFLFYFAVLYALSGIFAGINWGNSLSLISLAASSEDQGKSLGIGQSMFSLGHFLAPLFGGLIAGFDVGAVYYVCSFLVFISFLLLLTYVFRRKSKLVRI